MITPLIPLLLAVSMTSGAASLSIQNSILSVLVTAPGAIASLADWISKRSDILAARKSSPDMSHELTMLTASTNAWQHSILHGVSIHESALALSQAHRAAKKNISAVRLSDVSFIASIAFDTRILSGIFDHVLSDSGYTLSDFWHESIRGLPQWTSQGRVDQDFSTFLDGNSKLLEGLMPKAVELLESLQIAKNARITLAERISKAWEKYENDCLVVTHGFMGLQSTPHTVKHDEMKPHCQEYNLMKMERIIKRDLGDFLKIVDTCPNGQLDSYRSLYSKYAGIARELERGSFMQRSANIMTLAMYRDFFSLYPQTYSSLLISNPLLNSLPNLRPPPPQNPLTLPKKPFTPFPTPPNPPKTPFSFPFIAPATPSKCPLRTS